MDRRAASQPPRGPGVRGPDPARSLGGRTGRVRDRVAAMRRIACLLVPESAAAPSASRELLEIALAHSPRVEEGGTDHVYLDATGLRGLFGSEEQLARRLVAAASAR